MTTDLNRVFLFEVLTLVLTLTHKPAVVVFVRVFLTGGTRIRVFGSLSLDPRVLSGIGWRILDDPYQHKIWRFTSATHHVYDPVG